MDPVREYGLTALPRDLKVLLSGAKNNKDPTAVMVSDIRVPDTLLAREVLDYAKSELPERTFNHSMRVYYYGLLPIHHPSFRKTTLLIAPRRSSNSQRAIPQLGLLG